MSEQTAGALRAWFKRVEPLYPELFNTAHVICGNYDQAEDALRGAILEVWSEGSLGGMGFRERLRASLKEEALRLSAANDGTLDFTWPGIAEDPDDVILAQAAREDIEFQRVLMLRHGVGLSPGRIASITGLPASLVRGTINRFETRCRRKLPAKDRSRFDLLLSKAMQRQLSSRTGIPHPAAVYRAFEAEAATLQVPAHRLSTIIYRVLVLIMAVVCAVLFWLFAVLVQPPNLQSQSPSPTQIPLPQPGAQIETTYESEASAM